MKKQISLNRRRNIILLSAFVIGIVSIGLIVGVASAAPTYRSAAQTGTDQPQDETSQQSQDCAECHPNVEDVWLASPHAHAFDDQQFSQRWQALGKPGECLACHTTGYQSSTNTFAAEGVQCEACHGEAVEGHPPAVVPVKADSDYCGTCHTTTLSEWRQTGHGTAGVGCMDCHDPHSQKTLFENADDMCLNCHKEDMGAYLEDIHIQKGIGCVDCHALVIPPDPLPEDGIVPTGHTFTITPATCVACHTDALHAGFSLPGYEDGAKIGNGGANSDETEQASAALEATIENNTVEATLSSEQRIQALEATLASTRLSTLFQGGIIGIVFGGITVYYLARNRRDQSTQETEVDQENEDAFSSDDDMLDEQLEKVVLSIERFINWIKSKLNLGANKVKGEKPAENNDRTPKSK